MKIYVGVNVLTNDACAIWRKSPTSRMDSKRFRDKDISELAELVKRGQVFAFVKEPVAPMGFSLSPQASFRIGFWYGILSLMGANVKVVSGSEFVHAADAYNIAVKCMRDEEKTP